MMTTEQLTRDLDSLGQKLAGDAIVSGAMRRIEREPMEPPRPLPFPWRRLVGPLAACAAVCFGLWVVLSGNGGNSLYAQAVAALEEARTVHAVGQRWQDGRWVKGFEVIYERGHGVYEWSQHRGKVRLRIIDADNEWRFSPDEPTVRKSPARDALGGVREILAESRVIDRAARDASGDKVINGDACALYTEVHGSGQVRYHVWVDARNRIREFREDRLVDNQWQPDELSTVTYDRPVNRAVFVPKLPPEARIIDAEQALEASFPLAGAKYRQEVEGLTFAVHRVERLANGWFLVVSSLRPGEQLRREIRNNDSGPAAHNYGSLMMGTSFKRFADDPNRMRSYAPFTLASVYHDGLDVQWTLFEPLGAWELDANTFELSWRFSTIGKLAEKLQAQGKQTWAEFNSVVQLPAEARDVGVAHATAETYDAVAMLEPIVAVPSLRLKPVPFTEAEMEDFYGKYPQEPRRGDSRLYHGRAEPPSRITKEAYQQEVAAQIEESQRRRSELERAG